jgi:hypothetical protein
MCRSFWWCRAVIGTLVALGAVAGPAALEAAETGDARADVRDDVFVACSFAHPSYWRIDGKPYFSVYDLQKLVESFGGVCWPSRPARGSSRSTVGTSGPRAATSSPMLNTE